eukprot:2687497-Amphidinium_carterae.1
MLCAVCLQKWEALAQVAWHCMRSLFLAPLDYAAVKGGRSAYVPGDWRCAVPKVDWNFDFRKAGPAGISSIPRGLAGPAMQESGPAISAASPLRQRRGEPQAACGAAWLVTGPQRLDMQWTVALCAEVARTKPDFEGLATGLSTAAYKQLKLHVQSQKEDRKSAINAALGGVWHEERAHSAFHVGDIFVRYGEEVENLEHIVLHCPHWNKERREACLPSHTLVAPACVRLHLLPAPPPGLLPTCFGSEGWS